MQKKIQQACFAVIFFALRNSDFAIATQHRQFGLRRVAREMQALLALFSPEFHFFTFSHIFAYS